MTDNQLRPLMYVNQQLLAELTDNVMIPAHEAATAHIDEGPPQMTYMAVRAALETALANGLVKLAPRENWPKYIEDPADTRPAQEGTS